MYNNLALYYLNQMGIRPWIKRGNSLSGTMSTPGVLKLLVFTAGHLSVKAKSLMKQMMDYIDLPESEFFIISVQEDEPKCYKEKIGQYAPLVIWVLGLNQHQWLNNLNSDGLLLQSADPEYLICNPGEKRRVLQDLHDIKRLVS